MITRETVSEQFEALGSVPSNSVLDKCVEVCLNCGIDDPEEFVEQWMAFSISNLGGSDPTVEYLKQMERKELNKKDNALKKPKEFVNNSFTTSLDKSLNNEIPSYNSYINDTNISQTVEDIEYKPGAVVCTYGKLNPKVINWVNKCNKHNIEVQIMPNKKGEILDNKALYMYDNLVDKCNIIGDYMYDVGLQLCNKYLNNNKKISDDSMLSQSNTPPISTVSEEDVNNGTIDYSELSFVNASGQDPKKCIGRVVCDADGHLNSASVMVHSTDDQALRICHLNFNNLQSYDLYPGQICMIKGINPRGNTMHLSEVKSEISLSIPNSSQIMITNGPLHIFIASGPFTSPDDLKYEPFKKVISYVKQHQPNIIILLGPFIESQHARIIEGELNVTFNNFVETLLSDLMDVIDNKSKVLVVPSSKDAISAEVFPTPPYKLFKSVSKPNLLLLSDPSTINIFGLLITLTTTDIIKHMQEEELIHNVGRDIVKRCVRRIFSTRNLYPLYPPSYDVSLDTQLWSRFCEIEAMPHIMVLPSDNKCFTRDIDGCIILNPGRIVHTNSGTFSRLEIHPCLDASHWIEKLACQTVKI